MAGRAASEAGGASGGGRSGQMRNAAGGRARECHEGFGEGARADLDHLHEKVQLVGTTDHLEHRVEAEAVRLRKLGPQAKVCTSWAAPRLAKFRTSCRFLALILRDFDRFSCRDLLLVGLGSF